MQKKQFITLAALAGGILLEVGLLAGLLVSQPPDAPAVLITPHILGRSTAAPAGDETGAPDPEFAIQPPDAPLDSFGYPTGEEGFPDPDHFYGSEPEDSAGYPGPSGGGDSSAYPAPGDGGYDPGYPAWGGEPDQPGDYPPPGGDIPLDDQPDSTRVPPWVTAMAPTSVLPTGGPPTAAPTTAVPPTAVPPTAVPPTAVPTTAVPPTAVPSTATPSADLLAVPVADTLALDGRPGDPAWAAAPETIITTAGGANQSAAAVSLRAIYDQQRVYFLISWADPTYSFLRAAWEKQPDGSWLRLVSPENSGSDESVYDEDKIALLWPVGDLPGFDTLGCGAACHEGDAPEAKPYGSMYTPAGALADLWNWKAARNVSQLDDLYLDSTPYAKDNYWAGFQADPGQGGYSLNQTENRRQPAFMPADPAVKNAFPGFLLETGRLPFDDAVFLPGDRVAGSLAAPFTGDRGDITAAWSRVDGRWYLEFSRALVTGSPYDVQFDDLARAYPFSLATFDNTQIRHAYPAGSSTLRFLP